MENGEGVIYHNFGDSYTSVWSTENIDLLDAASRTDGKSNTDAIKGIPGWKDLYPAFAVVDELNKDGVTGWYLPAVDQLPKLKHLALNYGNYYWSSTGSGTNNAFRNYASGNVYHPNENSFDNGQAVPKTGKLYIIAIHDFSYDFSK